MTDGQKQLDADSVKYFLGIYSEEVLSAGGASEVDEYQSLQANMGCSYKTLIISSAPRHVYGNHVDSYQHAVGRTQLLNAVKNVLKRIASDRAAGKKRIQVVFNLLAHGMTLTGGGAGYIIVPPSVGSRDAVAAEDVNGRITFQELWSEVLEPLANPDTGATELIAILEPCFGGNILLQIPPSVLSMASRYNVLFLTGADTFSSAQGISAPQGAGGKTPYASTLLTDAVVKALKGYASLGKQGIFQRSGYESLQKLQVPRSQVVTQSDLTSYVEKYVSYQSCVNRAETVTAAISTSCDVFRAAQKGTKVTRESALSGVTQYIADDVPELLQEKEMDTLLNGSQQELERSWLFQLMRPQQPGTACVANPELTLGGDAPLAIASPLVEKYGNGTDSPAVLQEGGARCAAQLQSNRDTAVQMTRTLAALAKSNQFQPLTPAQMNAICAQYPEDAKDSEGVDR